VDRDQQVVQQGLELHGYLVVREGRAVVR
jgi:hypothetical protein